MQWNSCLEQKQHTCTYDTLKLLKENYRRSKYVESTLFTARRYAESGIATASRLFVCLSVYPSVTLKYCDHMRWNTSKIISRLISIMSLLSADSSIMDLLQM